MLEVNYGNIGGKLSPGVLFVICLRSRGAILMMNMRSLLGRWPSEGLNLRFSIRFMFLLVGLHGLVFVSSKTMPFGFLPRVLPSSFGILALVMCFVVICLFPLI